MTDQENKKFSHFPSFYEINRQESGKLYLNELENAVDSLETALTFFPRSDTLKWKWVAIALHHALYSFAVSCLINGNYENVFSFSREEDDNHYCLFGNESKWKKSKRIFRPDGPPAYMIQWEETPDDPTQAQKPHQQNKTRKEQLISFWTALARVQDSYFWMGRTVVSNALKLSEQEWKHIEWLTLEARNRLVHFLPISQSYSVSEFKEASVSVIRAIEYLALESKTIIYVHRVETRDRINCSIAELRKQLLL